MNTIDFLSYLRSLNIQVSVERGRLRCSAAQGALTPELYAELAERKAEVISFLQQASSSTSLDLVPLTRDKEISLSFAQQRLWFFEQLEPNRASYNIPIAIRLSGQLNVTALEQSLNAIINRHEVLRTNFATVAGQPVQVIAPTRHLTLPVLDLQGLPAVEREAAIQHLATEAAQQPFDLASEALVRGSLLQLQAAEYVLLLTIHHIVFDGWSLGILVRELTTLYPGFCIDKPPQLPQLSVQYADFALWQRQWLQGEVLSSQLTYWQQQLEGAPALLELPADRPRPAVQSFRGAQQSFSLSQEVSQALLGLSQEQGVTLFMTLLCAFQTLLYRYTGQEDILIGTPIANRRLAQLEDLIGFFANTLVLRTDLSGNPSFEQLLSRVREVALSAYTHQDLPFELLVEELQPVRDLSHTPLFQVMFVLQNAPMPTLALPGLTVSPLAVAGTTSKFDLTLVMEETEQGLVGMWEYSTDLFDATTIARMAGHFQTLLTGIVADPKQRLSDLPLLTESERQQLLVEWNNTHTEYPQVCIHQLFEAQVEQRPDAIAVVFGEQQLTYRELNCQANQLAHHLQQLGVGPEVLVGICVERSLLMVVGLLAILKAGGAYVPLDPAYPQERLAFILEDAQASVLLTQKRLVTALPQRVARVVCLDADWKTIAQAGGENSVSHVRPEHMAYLIYTSGSTGKPKGVAIEHHSTVSLLKWAEQVFTLEELAGVLASTSICFDLSVFEVFVPLSWGGTVILVENALHLPALKTAQNVTLINMVPSAVQELLRIDGIPASVRTVNLAGEPLQNTLVQQLYQLNHIRQVFNLYGPSEDTTYSTCDRVKRGAEGIPFIGRPIANTQVYLLDSHLQPVPIGVLGELYIGGDGLARGYINRSELTADKFIPNPFSARPGARLYKTGDIARYLPDGNIEYVGRIDYQVKIRGFRIELGEIEAVLSQHPAILQTVVIAREDVPGNKRLVAYLVSNQEEAPTISDLRLYLKEHLPEYMVPSAFVMLDTLPLTPNGKVDRRALPVLVTGPSREASFVAPRTSTEEALATIWADVLRVEVGIHDNFFELGGDSILSILIVARANQAGLQLAPKQLFQYQTIAELAAVAGTTIAVTPEQDLITGPMPLTPIQHWFFEQKRSELHHFNQSVLLEVPPDLKPSLLPQVVQQLLMHHDALRLRFVQDGGHWQQTNATVDETVPVSVVDLSAMASDEQQAAVADVAAKLQASLNLTIGPLLRVALFQLGSDQPGRLLFIVHHLAVDGVSWRILLTDFANIYQQLSCGEAMQLPPKTTAFRDWAKRLAEYGQSEAVAAELDYWLVQSRRAGVSSLPVDYPSEKEANTVASAAQVTVALSVEQTRALLQEVPSAYNIRINEVLLTALVQSFNQWTGERGILFDLEGHGREELFEDVDLSRTVGWFTSIFPVWLELGEASHPGEALKSVKEQLRHIPHRGIGYGILRYLSQDAAVRWQLQTFPQAEVIFNYLGQFDLPQSESLGLRLAPESKGGEHSSKGRRSHLLEVNGLIVSGRLQLSWSYSKNIHQRVTIERLAFQFMEALKSLIIHCQSKDAGGYTPSDFSAARLNQKQLDKFIAKIEQTGRR